ncbi:Retrovirus-related Pol polyprotein from transposon RE1 (Retro element 1) (AtRE1) [Includes: Protease RE1 [Durusdinium trenchii]|uniref:Retrovirus-related Pol polyprotein from transposon RE1 (Retro element 1) (AtRE1) n=1 Tax=Durusdinium trenchii TaxID=1381693 RepID=A0ABP0MU20_9DINO
MEDVEFHGEEARNCLCCREAKAARGNIPRTPRERTHRAGTLVYVDLTGKKPLGVGNHRYCLHVVEHATRYIRTYFLKTREDGEKMQALRTALRDVRLAHALVATRVVEVFADTEFYSERLKALALEEHAKLAPNPPHVKEPTGVVERSMRTLTWAAEAGLRGTRLPQAFWPFAHSFAGWLVSRIPPSAGGASPFTRVHGRKASGKNVFIFGSLCFYYDSYEDRPRNKGTMEPRARLGIYLGVSAHHRANTALVWSLDTACVIARLDIKVDETVFPAHNDRVEDLRDALLRREAGGVVDHPAFRVRSVAPEAATPVPAVPRLENTVPESVPSPGPPAQDAAPPVTGSKAYSVNPDAEDAGYNFASVHPSHVLPEGARRRRKPTAMLAVDETPAPCLAVVPPNTLLPTSRLQGLETSVEDFAFNDVADYADGRTKVYCPTPHSNPVVTPTSNAAIRKLSARDAALWEKSKASEVEGLIAQGTFASPTPFAEAKATGDPILPAHFIFSRKHDHRLKSRLVCNGVAPLARHRALAH